MKYSGCEIIATYNALVDLGVNLSNNFNGNDAMVNLISYFEENGAMLNGDFGVAPMEIEKYFKNNGYNVTSTSSTNEDRINNLGTNSETVIVTVYNDQNDIMRQVHTVCVTKDASGYYTIHNAYKMNAANKYIEMGGYNTLSDAISAISTDPKSIYTIGINK